MNRALYFIALIPPSPLKEEIQRLKVYMSEEYGSSHALKSPPHITLLAPFRLGDAGEKKLNELLKEVGRNQGEFEVTLRGYDAFAPRVLYIGVQQSRALTELQEKLESLARSERELFNYNYDSRPYHPHMTLAFRDLRKKEFYRAWEKFSTREFNASFTARDLCLLRHDGEKWVVAKKYPLVTC